MATLTVTVLHDTMPAPVPVEGARIVFLSGTTGVAEDSALTNSSGVATLTVTPSMTVGQHDVIYCNGVTELVADPDGIHSYDSWTYLPSRHNWREDEQGLTVTIYTKPCSTFILKGYDRFGTLLRFGNYRDMGGAGNVFTAAYTPDYWTGSAWVAGTKWGLLPEQYYGSVDDYSTNTTEVTAETERLRHIGLGEDGDQNELFRVPAIAVADSPSLSTNKLCIQVQAWPVWDTVGQRGLVSLCTQPLSAYGLVSLNYRFLERVNAVLFGLWVDYDGVGYPDTFFGSTELRDEYFPLLYDALNVEANNPWIMSEAQRGMYYTTLLAKLLDFQERARYTKALADIETNRKGTVTLHLHDGDGAAISGVQMRVQMTQRQEDRDFLFGIMPGTSSTYSHEDVLSLSEALPGRLGCFPVPWYQMAMVGNGGSVEQPGWDLDVSNYSDEFKEALGWDGWTNFKLRLHAMNYLLAGLIPPSQLLLSNDDFTTAMLGFVAKVVAAYPEDFYLWEVANEMGYTDCKGMTLAQRLALAAGALTLVDAATLTSVINSAHCKVPPETFDSDWETTSTAYLVAEWFRLETTSHRDFLRQMTRTGLDSIGIQLYPGSRSQNADASSYSDGPCPVPAYMLDLLDNYYRDFSLPLHVTEFSMPSDAAASWLNGFWVQDWANAGQGNWSPEIQADYAERAFTYAFSHAHCKSILWWDLVDYVINPAVKLGAAYDIYERMKPVFERLKAKILDDWTSKVDEIVTTTSGAVALPACFGGTYDVVLTAPDGRQLVTTAVIAEGGANALTLTWSDW